jgi:hypothetical protein
MFAEKLIVDILHIAMVIIDGLNYPYNVLFNFNTEVMLVYIGLY